jgi:hypothetical protein
MEISGASGELWEWLFFVPLSRKGGSSFFSPRHVVLPIFVPHCPVQGFLPSFFYHLQPACSFGWWLIAGADLF